MKQKVIIEARRTSYSTSDVGRTMTVRELIDYLENFYEDSPIYLSHDNGYTFGGIMERDINSVEIDEDDED